MINQAIDQRFFGRFYSHAPGYLKRRIFLLHNERFNCDLQFWYSSDGFYQEIFVVVHSINYISCFREGFFRFSSSTASDADVLVGLLDF